MQSDFVERARRVAVHGLGLSVDVYSPDLVQLDGLLRRHQLPVDYYEVFQAAPPALATVRERLSGQRLACHGEGLWISQPEFDPKTAGGSALSQVCAQARVLESQWLNIECATKQMSGLSFGTYLPPLYTIEGAMVAAENAAALQQELDRRFLDEDGPSPLLLVEMPPLTYFACGSLPIQLFFRELVDRAPCGLVLDIGHLWTVYRYTGPWRTQSVEQFLEEFLESFPLERVVEIHVAGLGVHPAEGSGGGSDHFGAVLPYWIDAHGEPIPAILFDMLDQVLSHPRLTTLKGVALEVDTKEPALIMSEFEAFSNRFHARFARLSRVAPSDFGPNRAGTPMVDSRHALPAWNLSRSTLAGDYALYAAVIVGQVEQNLLPDRLGSIGETEGLVRYQQMYLPYEILHWGGDLESMFPHTCRMAKERAVDLRDFVTFWFARPRAPLGTYDFFLLKIEYFVEFIEAVLPDASATVRCEAEDLRAGYEAANRQAGFEEAAA